MTALCLVLAACLDVGANLFLQKSDGFRKKGFGIAALIMVCAAFTLLAWVTRTLDLSVAYVSWGALAILGSCFVGRVFLDQRLSARGWLGIGVILVAIGLLNTA